MHVKKWKITTEGIERKHTLAVREIEDSTGREGPCKKQSKQKVPKKMVEWNSNIGNHNKYKGSKLKSLS